MELFECEGAKGEETTRKHPPPPCRDDLSLRGQGRKHAPFFSCSLFVDHGGRALYFQGLATRGVSLFVLLQFVSFVTFPLVDCAPNSLGLSHKFWNVVRRAIISNLLASYRRKIRSAKGSALQT